MLTRKKVKLDGSVEEVPFSPEEESSLRARWAAAEAAANQRKAEALARRNAATQAENGLQSIPAQVNTIAQLRNHINNTILPALRTLLDVADRGVGNDGGR